MGKGKSPIESCRLLNLPKIKDRGGNLTFIESKKHVDFDIKRVYYIYDVPGGAMRGGHAHKELTQLLIAISGSFDVHLDDGYQNKTFHLNRSNQGLLICPMVWRTIDNFSTSSICMVLASINYSEDDYYRDYSQFAKAATNDDYSIS